MTRTRPLAALTVALLLLAAGCGQKPGVAQLTQSGDATAAEGTGLAGEETGTGTLEGDTTSGDETVQGTGTSTSSGTRGAGRVGAAPRATAGPGASGPAAQGAADRTGISASEVRIGIHAPITGAAAVSTFEQGVGVYSGWAGKIAGLGNRQLKVAYRDDKFDPAAARQACRELVEKEKVFILIGGAGADQIESCAQYAQSVGVPYFSPGVTEGGFAKLTNYFALSETYNQQNVQVAQLIRNQVKKTKVAIVLTDSPLLKETEDSMRKAASDAGLEVVTAVRIRKDANKGDTDSAVSTLKGSGAEVIYALISPTVFIFLVSSAKQQQYFPAYVGPGLSNGLNLVAKAICQPPFPDVRYLSPMVQMDKIDQFDKEYQPAYRQKNGAGSQPDDIGILLWGLEKGIRVMLEAAGADVSRESLLATLQSGKEFATNVYAPVKFIAAPPHFGATQTTLLTLNCGRLEFDTTAAFVSSF